MNYEGTPMKAFVVFLAVALFTISLPQSTANSASCSVPPFIRAGTKPNVLIILDNSNSMDEDFYGEAVGSYSPDSKSVVAKNALKGIIDQYQEEMRVGLMTYRLPSGVSAYNLQNSPYFASYDPRSHCPPPPGCEDEVCQSTTIPACIQYCQTTIPACVAYCEGNSAKQADCQSGCQAGNGAFDATYFDEVIGVNAAKYCELIYPKTQKMHYYFSGYGNTYVYYKGAYPYYSPNPDPPYAEDSNSTSAFCYATTYSSADGASNTYKCYTRKRYNTIGASDLHPDDYFNNYVSHTFGPTDSDYALGYGNFGRRMSYEHVGPTWYTNSTRSSNQGFLQVSVNELSIEGVQTNTFLTLMNRLEPQEDDNASYMNSSCLTVTTDEYANACHIINAGLTPTAGTLASAITYLSGASTPMVDECQKTFIIYVTDGLPSVDESGAKSILNPDSLMPAVISRISQLRSLTVGGKVFDVRTYILGVGLSTDAKAKLDTMALAGGTARPYGSSRCTNTDGCAYYGDNATQLNVALTQIFSQLGDAVAAAGAVATVSQEIKTGDIIIRGAFKAYDPSDPATFVWEGHLESYWPYEGCGYGDGNESKCESMVGCSYDGGTCSGSLYSFQLPANLGSFCSDRSDPYCMDGAEVLSAQTTRTIFSWLGSTPQKTSLAAADSYLNNQLDLDDDSDIDGTDTTLLRSWIVGGNATNARNRHGWLLGDIAYSTPIVVGQPSLASVPRKLAHEDCGSSPTDQCFLDYRVREEIAYREGMVYVGANDGMLHAFNLDNWCATANRWIFDPADPYAVDLGQERWAYIPSNLLSELQCLADPTYGTLSGCKHRYMVDLSPQAWEVKIDSGGIRQWTSVLLGGERGGGDVYFALDITAPGDPDILWEYSSLKDYPGPSSNPAIAAGFVSHYDYLKTMNMSWSHPYMGRLRAPGYSNPNPYVAIVGGGAQEPRPDEVSADATSKLTDLQGWEYLYYPTFHAIDIDSGIDLWKDTWSHLVDEASYRAYFAVPSQQLQNTGFETNTGTTSAPVWPSWTITKGSGNVTDVTSAYAHAGSHAAKLVSSTGANTNISNTITVVPGTTYILSFWTRGTGSSSSAGRYQVIDVTHSSANIISTTSTSIYASTYQFKSVLFAVPDGCVSVTVRLWCPATSGRTCYFDDVTISPYVVSRAVSNVAAFDLFDENDVSIAWGASADGFTDVVFGGSADGTFYTLPTNTSGASIVPSCLITRKTKSVTNAKWNPFRGSRQPMTVTPVAALDAKGYLRVFFGTGKFLDVSEVNNDRTDNATMTFYGMVQDIRSRIAYEDNMTTITTISTPSSFKVYEKCAAGTGPYRWMKYGTDGVTIVPDGDSCFACQFDFDRPGERVIDSALVAAGYVFFTTFIPSTDPCNAGGTASLYVLDYMCRPMTNIPIVRGGSLDYRAVGSTATWTATKPDKVAVARVDLGQGMPSRPVMDSQGTSIIIQTSDTRLIRLETNLGYGGNAKINGWTRESD